MNPKKNISLGWDIRFNLYSEISFSSTKLWTKMNQVGLDHMTSKSILVEFVWLKWLRLLKCPNCAAVVHWSTNLEVRLNLVEKCHSLHAKGIVSSTPAAVSGHFRSDTNCLHWFPESFLSCFFSILSRLRYCAESLRWPILTTYEWGWCYTRLRSMSLLNKILRVHEPVSIVLSYCSIDYLAQASSTLHSLGVIWISGIHGDWRLEISADEGWFCIIMFKCKCKWIHARVQLK